MSDASLADDTLALARLVDQVCNRFETAWREGSPPRIEDFPDLAERGDQAHRFLAHARQLAPRYQRCR